jgi:serine/threonine-protein kinase
LSQPQTDQQLLEAHFGDRYELDELLRDGISRRVYTAFRKADGFAAVVKVDELDPRINRKALEGISERLASCSRIDHPNIVQSLDAVLDWKRLVSIQVMSRVFGDPLNVFLEQQADKVTIGALAQVIRQIASAIDTIHSHRLIHRDIKPQNILVDPVERRAIVSDFGVSLGCALALSGESGSTFGTPAYVAPEQIIGTQITPAADIYAFAVTIYNIATRCSPYEAEDARQLLYAHIYGEPVPLRRRNRSWPPEMARAVMKSLSKHPEERHQTARALGDEVAASLRPYTPFRLSSYFDGSLSRINSGEIPISF